MSDANSGLNGKRKSMFGKATGDKQKEIEERMSKVSMIVTFQRKNQPGIKTIWKAAGKPMSMTILRIVKTKQSWELPYWTVEYEIKGRENAN